MKSEKIEGLREGLKLAIKIIKKEKTKENAIEVIKSHLNFLDTK